MYFIIFYYKMGHITAAIEQQCRICKASAPKENIKNIKREHSNYFLINYVSNEKICSNCIQKYEVFKSAPFQETKLSFGYAYDQEVEDVSMCQPGFPCSYCLDKQTWRSQVESIPEKRDRSKAEKKYFSTKIAENCPSIALTPLKIKDSIVENIYRIEYRQRKRDWAYCQPCSQLINYGSGSNKSVSKHLLSKNHCNQTENIDTQVPVLNAPTLELISKEISNEQIIDTRQIISEEWSGKWSVYYLASDQFEQAFRRLFKVMGYHMPANRRLCGSRRTLMRMNKDKAIQIQAKVKDELALATSQNCHIVISTDDGSLNNGNRENFRTFNATWVNPDGQLCSRYLTSWEELNKKAEDLKKSLDEVKQQFEMAKYNNYSLNTDGASSNRKLAELDDNRQLNLCGPHGLNNTADCGIKQHSKDDAEFKIFNDHIKNFSSKASRRKYNQRFASTEKWVKLKSLADTRWDSMCIVLEAIIKNYDILVENKIDHPLFQNYPKQFLEEYFNLIVPMRNANVQMQMTTKTSGHLVALNYHNLLVHFLNYSSTSAKPPTLKLLAKTMAKEVMDRMDDTVRYTNKPQRVTLDRLLQAAFYPGSCFLEVFKTKTYDPEHQRIIDERVQKYQIQIQDWAKQKASDSSMLSSFVMDVSQTPIEFEIQTYIQLVRRLTDKNAHSTLPQVLVDFENNRAMNLDANAIFWTSSYAQQHLPHLSAEIMKLLPIPASTSLSEGTFTVANQIRNPKRSRITPENLNYFLTCHYARTLCPHNYTS